MKEIVEDVRCWLEDGGSIHLKAATKLHNDPVELSADEVRAIAKQLLDLEKELDRIDGVDLN